MNARHEAFQRLDGAYEVRVLEPSPPAVIDPPWYADDPTTRGGAPPGRRVVSPVTTGDLTWDELCRDDSRLAAWCADRWLGAWRPLPTLPAPEILAATRQGWHALAEHVLAPARRAACGKIGLRFTRHGFGTPYFVGPAGRGNDCQVRVEGVYLMVYGGPKRRWATLATVGAAAKLVGIEPGAPTDVYEPTTPLEPDAPLRLDTRSTDLLGSWFGLGASVLEQLRADADPGDDPSRVQLWPEHFDLSVDVGAGSARATFGFSPGDAEHLEPYLYVTPAAADAAADAATLFWNDASFGGASLSYSELLATVDQRATVLSFLRRGRDLLGKGAA